MANMVAAATIPAVATHGLMVVLGIRIVYAPQFWRIDLA